MTAEELGTVHFQTSCSSKVGADFNRGVALIGHRDERWRKYLFY
jgi:hypothetical protein